MSVRTRLLIVFVIALAAAAAAVATAGNGHKTHAATQQTTKTIPAPPTTQPAPPPVRTQTTPAVPRPLGNVPRIKDRLDRRELDAFIAERPELAPWKEEIWYVAHYSYSNVSARGLAGMMWCIVYRIPACSRPADEQAARLKRRR